MADGYMMNIPSIPFTRLAPLALEKLGFLKAEKRNFLPRTRGWPLYLVIDGVVSENSGVFPPNHPWINRVFHYFHHPFWGCSPYFWKHPDRVVTAIYGGVS